MLSTPDALVARQFLGERGFDKDAAEHFGVRLRAPRRGGAAQAPAPEGLLRGGAGRRRASSAQSAARALRPVPRPAAVADPRRQRRRRSGSAPAGSSTTTASRRSTSTPPRPRSTRSRQVLYGIDLARREIARASQAVVVEGYTDVMACHLAGVPHRRRDLRHGVRRRPRPGAAPVAARPRGVPRRGDLHLRRRRGRAEGGAAGLRRRPEVRRPRPTSRSSPTASTRATCGSRRATPRSASWWPAGCRSTASCSPTCSAATTSTVPTAGSTPCARRPSWCPRSATSPRSTRSPASWPA